jgi:hypothetical protein
VNFAYEAGLQEKSPPPVPLLKSYLEDLHKTTSGNLNASSDQSGVSHTYLSADFLIIIQLLVKTNDNYTSYRR